MGPGTWSDEGASPCTSRARQPPGQPPWPPGPRRTDLQRPRRGRPRRPEPHWCRWAATTTSQTREATRSMAAHCCLSYSSAAAAAVVVVVVVAEAGRPIGL